MHSCSTPVASTSQSPVTCSSCRLRHHAKCTCGATSTRCMRCVRCFCSRRGRRASPASAASSRPCRTNGRRRTPRRFRSPSRGRTSTACTCRLRALRSRSWATRRIPRLARPADPRGGSAPRTRLPPWQAREPAEAVPAAPLQRRGLAGSRTWVARAAALAAHASPRSGGSQGRPTSAPSAAVAAASPWVLPQSARLPTPAAARLSSEDAALG